MLHILAKRAVRFLFTVWPDDELKWNCGNATGDAQISEVSAVKTARILVDQKEIYRTIS